jgi:hypothetical protein
VPDSADIAALQHAIRDRYGIATRHGGSVDVNQVFPGGLPFPGIVSIFHLEKHPKATMAYAWRSDADAPPVIMLAVPPIKSAIDAVRTWLASRPG